MQKSGPDREAWRHCPQHQIALCFLAAGPRDLCWCPQQKPVSQCFSTGFTKLPCIWALAAMTPLLFYNTDKQLHTNGESLPFATPPPPLQILFMISIVAHRTAQGCMSRTTDNAILIEPFHTGLFSPFWSWVASLLLLQCFGLFQWRHDYQVNEGVAKH